MTPSVRILVLVVLTALTGCGPNRPPLAPPEPPVVTITHPEVRELDAILEFTGRFAAVETQEIRAQVTGYLKEIKFEEGGAVKEGQALYEIEPEPYDAALANAVAMVAKAQNDVSTAESQLDLAKKDYDRVRNSTTAFSRQETDKAKSTYDTAETNLAAAKANVEAAVANRKKAQFDRTNCTVCNVVKGVGRISRTEITKGNLVLAGQTLLCRVTSTDPIYVFFDVDEDTSLQYRRRIFDEKSLPNPRDGAKLDVWVATKDEPRGADGKWPHHGFVNYVAPEVIRGLGTREVRGVIANPDQRLAPGDSARVQVTAGSNKKVTLLPEIAIGSRQQQKFVYVVVDKDGKSIAEFRPVATGPVREIGGMRWQVIANGVGPSDHVVVNGLLRVRPGAEVKATEQSFSKPQ